MTILDLHSTEFAPHFYNYIQLVGQEVLLDSLESGILDILSLSEKITKADKEKFNYLSDKWTCQELILHLTDAERIFSYRALCIARNDKTHFPGFEEDNYVKNAYGNDRSFDSIISEFVAVRNATISLFESFNEQQLLQIGTASNNPISVRAIGFIILGHQKHHFKILEERYLN